MASSIISALCLLCVFAALIYGVLVGARIFGSTGCVSPFGIPVTLFGLIVGWLLERFLPFLGARSDWNNPHGSRLEVQLLFLFVTAVTVLAVTLVRRDFADGPGKKPDPRQAPLLIPMFLLAVGMTARGKVAALLVILFSRLT
jgi:hypothetical protein